MLEGKKAGVKEIFDDFETFNVKDFGGQEFPQGILLPLLPLVQGLMVNHELPPVLFQEIGILGRLGTK